MLGMIYILYADKYLGLIEQKGANAAKTFIWNSFNKWNSEALVAGLIVSAVSVALIRKGKK